MIGWAVSLSDVEKHPKWNGNNLDEILALLGMDVSKGYQEDGRHLLEPKENDEETQFNYYHINFDGEEVKCPRYEGIARQDGKWKRAVLDFLGLEYE